MLRLGAAAAVGAGVSLAAVHGVHRLRANKTAAENRAVEQAGDFSKAVQVGEEGTSAGLLLERDTASDWGSPVLPENRDANKTMSPSKLPRPRKLFSDREGECNEVCACRRLLGAIVFGEEYARRGVDFLVL